MAVSFRYSLIWMYFFKVISTLKYLIYYTVFKNNYTSWYLFWSNLSATAVVFSWHFVKIPRKRSEEASIFSKLQVHENIREDFSFSATLKAEFCNNVLFQVLSLVESCFIEIRGLLPVTLQRGLRQVSFLGISRTNILQRCIHTKSNIQGRIYCKNSLCF